MNLKLAVIGIEDNQNSKPSCTHLQWLLLSGNHTPGSWLYSDCGPDLGRLFASTSFYSSLIQRLPI